MQTTFLKNGGSRSVVELCKALETRLQDDLITALLQKRETEFDLLTSVALLKTLAKGSNRGKAMAFNDGFRNKVNWAGLVERIAGRILNTASGNTTLPANLAASQFVSISSSLARLRFGEVASLQKLPREPSAMVHLVRYAAEINTEPELIDLAELRSVVKFTERSPQWLPGHVMTSVAMLFKRRPDVMQMDPLASLIPDLLRELENRSSTLPQRDLEDLSDPLTVVSLAGYRIPPVLVKHSSSGTSEHSRRRRVQTSKFQEEIHGIIERHFASITDLIVEVEAADGVDLRVTLRGEEKAQRKVAIQCYGPTHYVWDGSRIEGRTAFKEFLLTKVLKYDRVVGIKHEQWERERIDTRLSRVQKALQI